MGHVVHWESDFGHSRRARCCWIGSVWVGAAAGVLGEEFGEGGADGRVAEVGGSLVFATAGS
jgi:hypothetical protein